MSTNTAASCYRERDGTAAAAAVLVDNT